MDDINRSIVKSLSGHDKNKLFIIIEVIEENYVRYSDGRTRPIERAKLKKLKHIEVIGKSDLGSEVKLTNKILREAINRYTDSLALKEE
ncbi:KOW domain-containing RNA-binding protein [Eubacteriales bacterium OttesenSCG-928-G02]|nr:KOW domain-containing RNA-binding protein [Eubacteriales bacterium OttesenSCG-928-G02]